MGAIGDSNANANSNSTDSAKKSIAFNRNELPKSKKPEFTAEELRYVQNARKNNRYLFLSFFHLS